jgi:hypothetical protein
MLDMPWLAELEFGLNQRAFPCRELPLGAAAAGSVGGGVPASSARELTDSLGAQAQRPATSAAEIEMRLVMLKLPEGLNDGQLQHG